MEKDKLLFGAAYYYEYMPEERLEKDMDMLSAAGFNLIRIAESTWSTWEPADGQFDFRYLHCVLDAAERHGIQVIVGTPTYAIPAWLAMKYPDILSETHQGKCRYGARQNFDITHPGYLFHAERMIRRLMEAVQPYACVIGFQLDNETKSYDTCSSRAQGMFREWLQRRFESVEALNQEMGLTYWSNSIHSWDELPDVRGTINGSLGGEYQAFQRQLVTDFLVWQRRIVDEYRRADQFITHNFDFEWRNYSFGLQPEVDQFAAAAAVTTAGCDIYHPSAGELTGAEIAFGGAIAYGLKKQNYYVLETQAQGNLGWLPYPGQLRLQAFSHLAAGADCIEYWHWHSIHNAMESYWKGVLSHDFSEGAVYKEAAAIGRDLKQFSRQLIHLKKKNQVAVMVSSRSQTGLQWFPTCQQGEKPDKNYSDYLRWICDSLYRLNIEYDIIADTERDFTNYRLLILPCLYAADDTLLETVDAYVRAGGHLLATFKTGFCNRYLKIYHDRQPHGLSRCLGLSYDRFTKPVNVRLHSDCIDLPNDMMAADWMELPEVTSASALCIYEHPAWQGIPAVTLNNYGEGRAAYLACCFSGEGLDSVLAALLPQFDIELPDSRFPLVIRSGMNQDGQKISYYFNYSGEVLAVTGRHPAGYSLPDGRKLDKDEAFTLRAWDFLILVHECAAA